MSKGYKWIASEIASLDPHKDYEQIWKLSTCYYVNDFMMNFLYSTGFPHFILPPRGGEVIARGGKGKIIKQQDRRESDTAKHFWRWFEYGPSDPITQRSVAQVNALHQGVANQYPGRFTHLRDFTYTMCWIGADMHRLRLRVGLPGFTENQKIAAHVYWQEMAKLFRGENSTEISDFPDGFEGMLRYMDEYEAVDWEYSPDGAATCEAIFEQFSKRWFPRGLQFLGRAMLLSLLDEPAHRVHRLPDPGFLTRKFFEFGFAAMMVAKERILPDPQLSTPEKHRLAAAGAKDPLKV
ncbi:hypothetical protein AB0N24_26740 [Arthrobacter sp. NPDC093128]|uniref:hypothetical protein n=1 Tax=Arthrobacter sp. NPDC093128 TaxID=3154979 RepID=UPI00343BD74A